MIRPRAQRWAERWPRSGWQPARPPRTWPPRPAYPVTAIRDAENGRRDFPRWLWLALDGALGARGILIMAHARGGPVVPAVLLPYVPDIGGAAIAGGLAERELVRAGAPVRSRALDAGGHPSTAWAAGYGRFP
jgi:hypothetical protein